MEKSYYELLVAQRQLAIARMNSESTRNTQLLASNVVIQEQPPRLDEELIESDKALVVATGEVKALTASLNLLLGYPVDTELQLVPPVTQYEDISLKEATDRAMMANPEVVEAEQNVVKARAASKLSKLDYVPDFEVLGGYAYQNNLLPPLPRDFSFIGLVGSYNLFDFGKREHTIKERDAQLAMTQTALQLTKAEVAASVKSSYFAMEQARQLSELAHRMASTVQLQAVSYAPENVEFFLTRAKLEVEMFQADLEYRQACAALKDLMLER